jgi:hypothetical protein
MPIPKITAIYRISKKLEEARKISLLESYGRFRSSESTQDKLLEAKKIAAYMILYVMRNSSEED